AADGLSPLLYPMRSQRHVPGSPEPTMAKSFSYPTGAFCNPKYAPVAKLSFVPSHIPGFPRTIPNPNGRSDISPATASGAPPLPTSPTEMGPATERGPAVTAAPE